MHLRKSNKVLKKARSTSDVVDDRPLKELPQLLK